MLERNVGVALVDPPGQQQKLVGVEEEEEEWEGEKRSGRKIHSSPPLPSPTHLT